MKSSAALISALVLALASCSDGERGHYPPNTTQKADSAFLRFKDLGKGEGLMETAIATYEGEKGEIVELISAVHVGDRSYYAELEKIFAGYDSLLYELILQKGAQPPEKGRRAAAASGSMISMFQRYMRDTLELDFQLEAIDYRAKNFVHADLDAETFTQLSEERGETLLKLMFKLALSEMGETSKADPNMGWKLLAALFLPDRARALKFLLAQQMENLESVLAGLGEGEGGKGSVILTERNKQCMRVLRERLRKGEKKIGIFYGGAHLPDLEERIFAEIGYRRTGVRWLAAWTIAKKRPAKKAAAKKAAEKKAAEKKAAEKK